MFPKSGRAASNRRSRCAGVFHGTSWWAAVDQDHRSERFMDACGLSQTAAHERWSTCRASHAAHACPYRGGSSAAPSRFPWSGGARQESPGRCRAATGLLRVGASLFRGSLFMCVFGDLGGAADGSLDVNPTAVESSRLSSLPDRPTVTARMAGNRPDRLAWLPQRMDLHVLFLCRRQAQAPLRSDTSC